MKPEELTDAAIDHIIGNSLTDHMNDWEKDFFTSVSDQEPQMCSIHKVPMVLTAIFVHIDECTGNEWRCPVCVPAEANEPAPYCHGCELEMPYSKTEPHLHLRLGTAQKIPCTKLTAPDRPAVSVDALWNLPAKWRRSIEDSIVSGKPCDPESVADCADELEDAILDCPPVRGKEGGDVPSKAQ
jgi:hypothetical protein